MQFRLRIQPSLPHYDDGDAIKRFARHNGTTFEADTLEDATEHLRSLGLDVGHGLGLESSSSGYPSAGDAGFRIWHLTGKTSRRRLGNNCKIQQLRTPRKAA